MSIEIVVDEFVIRGLPPEYARAAAVAFERRLTALAAGSTDAMSPRVESVLRLPSVRATSAAGVGQAVAGAVWNGLGGAPQGNR